MSLTVGNTLLMALREIRRNTLRSSLTTLGIVIGVAAVIALMTLGDGASRRVTSEISGMGVNMLSVTPGAHRRGPTQGSAQPLTLADADAIARSISTVAAVAPSASSASLAVYANKNWNTLVTGTTNAYFSVRALKLEDGRMFADAELTGGLPTCVLGATVRRELFGRQDPLGASIRVGRVSCRVIGTIVSKGQSTFGMDQDDFILMPLGAFQRRVAGSDNVGAIAVSAVSESAITRTKNQLLGLMRQRRRIAEGQSDDFEVRDTREIVKTLQSVTGVLTALLTAVAAVSLVVGGIGIMNIMLVSVTERTREIGIRKALGATRWNILAQFLIEAVVLCCLGGIVGIGIGAGGAMIMSKLAGFTTHVSMSVVGAAFAFSAGVGVLFGVWPARSAAIMDPIIALRYE